MYCLHIHDARPEGGEGLLATVVTSLTTSRLGPTEFVTDPSKEIQVGILHRFGQQKIPRHTHRPFLRQIEKTSEVLIIRRGLLHIRIYSSSGEYAGGAEARAGDVIILYQGAHEIDILETCEIIEVKQGPFQNDKVLL